MAKYTEKQLEKLLEPFVNPNDICESARLFFMIKDGRKIYTIKSKKERMVLYVEQCVSRGLIESKESRMIEYDLEELPYDSTLNEHPGGTGIA